MGHGSFGDVHHYELGRVRGILFSSQFPRDIAVKMLHRALRPVKKLPVIREVNVHGSLKHINIVQCYGYCLVNNTISLALEFCEMDLRKYLESLPEKKLDEAQLLSVLQQLASVLKATRHHGTHGIIHRDFKPGNILIRNKDLLDVAVSDFGLSKVIMSCNSTFTQRVGTPNYMAPEVLDERCDLHLNNSGDMGHSIDIYSLGVVAFELSTGKRLPKATSEDVITKKFQDSKHLIKDPELANLIQSCLSWNPQERIKKEELLRHDYFLPRGLRHIREKQRVR